MTFDSLCVHESVEKRTTKPHNLPIYATASFDFDNIEQGMDVFSGKEQGHLYSRFANPTVDAVAEKIAKLESFDTDATDASAYMVSSGMAAISTLIFGVLKSGDKIMAQGNLYGGTTMLFRDVLPAYGIETVWTDLRNLKNVQKTLKKHPSIKMIYMESLANPTLAGVDMKALSDIAKQTGYCMTAVDNTFCTPFLLKPFAFGVDFIIHSTTKYLNGHGNSTAGVIVGRDSNVMKEKVWTIVKLVGTNCSPFEAWLTSNGLKTLPLRMVKHSDNALKIAQFLEKHHAVMHVNYPYLKSHADHKLIKNQMPNGCGGMLSFELKGGLEAGLAFMNKIKFCSLAPTMGDVDTLILHPASMSHLKIPREIRLENGITDGLIRVSVGIEDVNDIINDLAQAMNV